MSDRNTNVQAADPSEWANFLSSVNENFAQALEENIDAQAQFVDSWFAALEKSIDEDEMKEGIEGYANAYEIWTNALEQSFERSRDSFTGEEVSPREFRDIWLNAANEAFKEVAGTAAFAAMTGRTVEDALQLRQEIDAQAEETLSMLGFATRDDVVEIGERIIELERRQHSLENKIDEFIDSVNSGN